MGSLKMQDADWATKHGYGFNADVVLQPEHFCENPEWWYGRKLDWTLHAADRSIERELPFPEYLPQELTLSPGKYNEWFINCKVDGMPLSIIAIPRLVYGKMVAKVVTVYSWDLRKIKRKNRRRDITHIRRAVRANVKARKNLTSKSWQNET
jgi:hypothetical protein